MSTKTDQEPRSRYDVTDRLRALWREVLRFALLDACRPENDRETMLWAASKDLPMVCALAEDDPEKILALITHMMEYEREGPRQYLMRQAGFPLREKERHLADASENSP